MGEKETVVVMSMMVMAVMVGTMTLMGKKIESINVLLIEEENSNRG
jgi:hypothetical protein